MCAILEIDNYRQTASSLDEDEKGVISNDTLSGSHKTAIINEYVLYNLIFRSRKPQAKQFKKRVTSEVLPTIRKHGRYEIAKSYPQV